MVVVVEVVVAVAAKEVEVVVEVVEQVELPVASFNKRLLVGLGRLVQIRLK